MARTLRRRPARRRVAVRFAGDELRFDRVSFENHHVPQDGFFIVPLVRDQFSVPNDAQKSLYVQRNVRVFRRERFHNLSRHFAPHRRADDESARLYVCHILECKGSRRTREFDRALVELYECEIYFHGCGVSRIDRNDVPLYVRTRRRIQARLIRKRDREEIFNAEIVDEWIPAEPVIPARRRPRRRVRYRSPLAVVPAGRLAGPGRALRRRRDRDQAAVPNQRHDPAHGRHRSAGRLEGETLCGERFGPHHGGGNGNELFGSDEYSSTRPYSETPYQLAVNGA